MKELATITTIIAILSVAFVSGYGLCKDLHNQELLKRGLKQYNQQTGKLEWTEKGGGND